MAPEAMAEVQTGKGMETEVLDLWEVLMVAARRA